MTSRYEQDETATLEHASALVKALREIMADPDGFVDIEATLECLACVSGWLLSAVPERDRASVLEYHIEHIESSIEENRDYGLLAPVATLLH